MEHAFTKSSEVEENILLTLLKHSEEGLTRQQLGRGVCESNMPIITGLLQQLEARKLVSAAMSMVLDDIDPDDVVCWSISAAGLDYLKEQRLIVV